MPKLNAKIANVIEVIQENERAYFTLEGILIGSFKSGIRIEPEPQVEPKKQKGAVLTSPTPKEVKHQKEVENERKINQKYGL